MFTKKLSIRIYDISHVVFNVSLHVRLQDDSVSTNTFFVKSAYKLHRPLMQTHCEMQHLALKIMYLVLEYTSIAKLLIQPLSINFRDRVNKNTFTYRTPFPGVAQNLPEPIYQNSFGTLWVSVLKISILNL
jgi:hypothetical protein